VQLFYSTSLAKVEMYCFAKFYNDGNVTNYENNFEIINNSFSKNTCSFFK